MEAFNAHFTRLLLIALVLHQFDRPFGIGVIIAAAGWALFCSWLDHRNSETVSR